jgi:hypothetical protein
LASGPDTICNGYHYQVFAGFGNSVLSDIPLTLMAGEWITLCTIPVGGTDVFTIVNDGLTAAMNGNYYVSLGGQESQGDIIEFITAVAGIAPAEEAFRVYPTITSGQVTIETDLDDDDPLRLSLVNAAGQEVRRSTLSGVRGRQRSVIDMSGLDAGAYMVRSIIRGRSLVRRVVKD